MRAGGGKAKGSAFERTLAKMILKSAKRAGHRFSKEDCYRTPMSGGHVYASKENPSDLVISRKLLKLFPFTVEAKFHRKIGVQHFARPVHKHEKSWPEKRAIDQVLRANEKKKHKRFPIVLMKENRGEIFAITTLPAIRAVIPNSGFPIHGLRFNYASESWIIVYFKEFLKYWRRELRKKR